MNPPCGPHMCIPGFVALEMVLPGRRQNSLTLKWHTDTDLENEHLEFCSLVIQWCIFQSFGSWWFMSLVMWHNLRSHSFLPDQECHLAYKLYTYQHHYMLLWQHLQQLFFSFLKEKVNFVDRTACGVFPPLSLWSQTCSNEVKCICASDYTGKDCSVFDPIPIPTVPTGPEKKGSHCSEASLSFPHSFFLSFMVSVHHHRSFMY